MRDNIPDGKEHRVLGGAYSSYVVFIDTAISGYYLAYAIVGYLFDHDEPIYSTIVLLRDQLYYEDYSYPMPLSARLTVTVRF